MAPALLHTITEHPYSNAFHFPSSCPIPQGLGLELILFPASLSLQVLHALYISIYSPVTTLYHLYQWQDKVLALHSILRLSPASLSGLNNPSQCHFPVQPVTDSQTTSCCKYSPNTSHGAHFPHLLETSFSFSWPTKFQLYFQAQPTPPFSVQLSLYSAI